MPKPQPGSSLSNPHIDVISIVLANWDDDELKDRAKEIKESLQLSIGLLGWQFESAD
jgi:hypothetical protein